MLRNCDGKKVTESDVQTLANWNAKAPAQVEIPFVVARVVLQDFTGVPLLVDLAAMRSTRRAAGPRSENDRAARAGGSRGRSLRAGRFLRHRATRCRLNLELEFKRNRERYQLLKWGQQAFKTFGVVPPGIGIVHQVNLEYLAKGVLEKDGVYYPDTLVGTDSHTTMINGLGVVGWGVGGIEAEAGMLGQPVYFLTPEVVGVHLTGALSEGVTATDLVLHITQMLRKAKVVGKFVEFYGPGAKSLPVVDRATIANMAPEYGATMGFFGVDEETSRYLARHRPQRRAVHRLRELLPGAGALGHSGRKAQIDYTRRSRARSLDGGARRRRAEAPAGSHRAAGLEEHLHRVCSPRRCPKAAMAKTAEELGEESSPCTSTAQRADRGAGAVFHGGKSDAAHMQEGDAATRARDGDQPPDARRRRTSSRALPTARRIRRSATAPCSSPRSRAARTPPTRA